MTNTNTPCHADDDNNHYEVKEIPRARRTRIRSPLPIFISKSKSVTNLHTHSLRCLDIMTTIIMMMATIIPNSIISLHQKSWYKKPLGIQIKWMVMVR